jgi:hypothetical protein
MDANLLGRTRFTEQMHSAEDLMLWKTVLSKRSCKAWYIPSPLVYYDTEHGGGSYWYLGQNK